MSDTLCPGLYCGRINYNNGTFSECGPCPLGYRSANNFLGSSNSECRKCMDSLELYDYLFLVFIFLSQLTFEFYIIDKSIKRSILTFETIVLYVSSAVETALSAAGAFFIYAADYPGYRIRICRSHNVYDWYSLLEDPVHLRGKQFIRCGREIVYPLYSLPFCFLFLSLVCLLLIRSTVICKFKIVNGSLSIYLTLYLIPILAFIHFIFAGLIYYFYPYILLIGSVISIAIHFAIKLDQKPLSLLREMIMNRKSTCVVLHMCILHMVALTALIVKLKLSYLLLLTCPIPCLFYILTSKFTQPSRFQ